MAKTTEAFRNAILKSLYELQESNGRINADAVIENAKFENGKPVGKSTLYRKKSDGTGERIHEDLIRQINLAKDGALTAQGKVSRGDTIKDLKEERMDLNQQLINLADQIIEQEERLINSVSSNESDRDVIKRLEEDLYILYSIISSITPRSSLINKLANEFIRKYEIKSESTTIKRAKDELNEYISDMKDSTLIMID